MGMKQYKRHGDYNQDGCGFFLFALAVLFIVILSVEMLLSYLGVW